MRRTATCGLVLLLALAAATPAEAQRRRNNRTQLRDAVAQLDSSEPDEIRAGIEALATVGTAGAVEPLAARVRRGLPADLLDLAVETLGVLGRPEAGPVLFQLSNHRRADVRLAAVSAITACRPDGASGALVSALSDADPRVRGAAATGLGQVGARDAIDTLFLALDRGVLEAASSIGQLATDAAVTRLLTYLGRIPFDGVAPAFDEVFARDDLGDAPKLEVIARLEELATAEVRSYLSALVDSYPPGSSSPVPAAAQQAIGRIAE